MQKPRLTDRQRQMYDLVQSAARDRTSEFWIDGGTKRHTGAAHRNQYWAGLDGKPFVGHKDSLAYACWKAGNDDAKTTTNR